MVTSSTANKSPAENGAKSMGRNWAQREGPFPTIIVLLVCEASKLELYLLEDEFGHHIRCDVSPNIWRILLFVHFTLPLALLGAVTIQAVAL